MSAVPIEDRIGSAAHAAMAPVLLLSIVHGLALVDRMLFAGVAPAVRADLALDHAQLGWLLGPAFALGYAPAVLLLGRVADRSAPVRLMVGGLALWSVAGALTGLADSVAALTAARLAMGIGQAAFVPAALVWLVAAASDARRPQAVSWFTAGSTAGRSTALLLTGALLAALHGAGVGEERSWRALLVITVLPNLIALLLLLRLPALQPVMAPPIAGWLRAHGRVFAPFVALALTPLILIQMFAAWLPELMVLRWALDTATAATLVGACALIGAPTGHLAGGWWLTRRPAWRDRLREVLAGTVVAALPAAALIGWAPDLVATAIGITALSFALGVGSFSGMFGVQALVPAGLRGVVSGFYLALVVLVGVGGGPLLAGVLSAAGGGTGAALRDALAASTAAVAVLALALLLLPARPRTAALRC